MKGSRLLSPRGAFKDAGGAFKDPGSDLRRAPWFKDPEGGLRSLGGCKDSAGVGFEASRGDLKTLGRGLWTAGGRRSIWGDAAEPWFWLKRFRGVPGKLPS